MGDLSDFNELSEIQTFYKDTTILLTGCTGFLGKILLEKLLRACEVKKIYCIVRDKKNQLADERFHQMFESKMFDNVKNKYSNLKEKVCVISGDCLMENLGLNEKDRNFLVENIEVIFHVAATIRFNRKLKAAIQINVKTTKYLLDMAKEMKQLKALIYTSSAYSNCDKEVIHEVIYKNRISVHKFLTFIEDFDEDFVNKVTPNVLGKLPNTYVFTKALAEELLLDYGKLECKLPIVIVRPSILSSAYKEPLPGWIDSWFTIGSISAAGSYGLLRSANSDPDKLADIVPTDYAANCLIASGIKAKEWNMKEFELPIFNFVTSVESPITWGDYTKKCFQMGMNYAPIRCCRYPCVKLTRHKIIHKIRAFYMHHLPAHICDVVLYVFGSKFSVRFFYKLLHNFLDETSYFSTRQWKFCNDNVQKLWNGLSPLDQQLFHFSMKDFDWDDYILEFLRNGRVYLLQDSMETLPQARRRLKVLKIIHYIIIILEYAFLLWIDYLILCYFNFL
ncbi:fatty acyl-CoA reductase wat-like [Atheta coriaria]|uniref:fatty acyl-CoA reductase wat-like n=1 Tax=Dalotia coriaria TaxID=877792 RepID=UPI0031F3619E